MGSILEFQSPAEATLFRIYITGNTPVIDDLKEIPRRYPDIHLALLHLGGTEVMGIMVTMDGKQGVEAMRIVNPQKAIPIHYNDYDVFKSPLPRPHAVSVLPRELGDRFNGATPSEYG